MMENNVIHVKLVLLGESSVGKTSILNRYIHNQFLQTLDPTHGIAFNKQIVNYKDKVYNFQIWDTAGQEKYRSMATFYYKDAQVAILVYDITSVHSFEVVKQWVNELQSNGPKELITIIVGNKVDLIENEQVQWKDLQEFIERYKLLFTYTSAKDNKGIAEMFLTIAEKIYNSEQNIGNDPDPYNIDQVKRIPSTRSQHQDSIRLNYSKQQEKQQRNLKCCEKQ